MAATQNITVKDLLQPEGTLHGCAVRDFFPQDVLDEGRMKKIIDKKNYESVHAVVPGGGQLLQTYLRARYGI